METFWKLVSACIIPIISFAGETRKPTKEENKKLNQLLDRIIRRILMVPESTPRDALYIESGLLVIETLAEKNRMMMGESMKKNGNQLLNEVTKSIVPGGWKELLKKTKEKYDVTDEDLQKSEYTRKNINKKITAACLQKNHGTEWREQVQNKLPLRRHRRMDPKTAQIVHAPPRKNPGKYHI